MMDEIKRLTHEIKAADKLLPDLILEKRKLQHETYNAGYLKYNYCVKHVLDVIRKIPLSLFKNAALDFDADNSLYIESLDCFFINDLFGYLIEIEKNVEPNRIQTIHFKASKDSIFTNWIEFRISKNNFRFVRSQQEFNLDAFKTLAQFPNKEHLLNLFNHSIDLGKLARKIFAEQYQKKYISNFIKQF